MGTIGVPTEVVLGPDDRMPDHCHLSFDNVVTVPKSLLAGRICALGPELLRQACRAWADVAGC